MKNYQTQGDQITLGDQTHKKPSNRATASLFHSPTMFVQGPRPNCHNPTALITIWGCDGWRSRLIARDQELPLATGLCPYA